jgi:shikimate kinase
MEETAKPIAPAVLPAPRRIVLTGFMGAGKTTVGLLLARRLHWRFLDVDACIEAESGKSIAQLFEAHGEPWFRELEHETIRRLVELSSVVLALGGGALEDARTRELLLSTGTTRLIHLEVTLETVMRRCHGTESVRPILRDRDHLEERYLRRLPFYRQSHLGVAVDALPAAAVAEAILDALTDEAR